MRLFVLFLLHLTALIAFVFGQELPVATPAGLTGTNDVTEQLPMGGEEQTPKTLSAPDSPSTNGDMVPSSETQSQGDGTVIDVFSINTGVPTGGEPTMQVATPSLEGASATALHEPTPPSEPTSLAAPSEPPVPLPPPVSSVPSTPATSVDLSIPTISPAPPVSSAPEPAREPLAPQTEQPKNAPAFHPATSVSVPLKEAPGSSVLQDVPRILWPFSNFPLHSLSVSQPKDIRNLQATPHFPTANPTLSDSVEPSSVSSMATETAAESSTQSHSTSSASPSISHGPQPTPLNTGSVVESSVVVLSLIVLSTIQTFVDFSIA